MRAAAGENGDGEDEEEDVDGMTRLVTSTHVRVAPVKSVVTILDVRVHARALGVVLTKKEIGGGQVNNGDYGEKLHSRLIHAFVHSFHHSLPFPLPSACLSLIFSPFFVLSFSFSFHPFCGALSLSSLSHSEFKSASLRGSFFFSPFASE